MRFHFFPFCIPRAQLDLYRFAWFCNDKETLMLGKGFLFLFLWDSSLNDTWWSNCNLIKSNIMKYIYVTKKIMQRKKMVYYRYVVYIQVRRIQCSKIYLFTFAKMLSTYGYPVLSDYHNSDHQFILTIVWYNDTIIWL